MRLILLSVLLFLGGCAGSPARLCFASNKEGDWAAFTPPPSVATQLEQIAVSSDSSWFGSGKSKTSEQRRYWFQDLRGDIALCYQTPGSQDFCFSSVWTFTRNGTDWQVASSSWNMCTG
jgi:hypothetical protein